MDAKQPRLTASPLTIRNIIITLFLSILSFTAGCSGPEKEQWQLIDMLNAERQTYTVSHTNWSGGLALYIITPSQTYAVYSGFSAYDSTTSATRFRGADVTMTFTAAAIMRLDQTGLLDIDDVLTDNIPGTADPYLPADATYNIPYVSSITIRQLLQHMGGVFDVAGQTIPDTVSQPYAGKNYLTYIREDSHLNTHTFTFGELAGIISTNGLYTDAPGNQFAYSKTGYMLLGKIIERVSGKTYQQYITDTFLTPLALNQTSFPSLGTALDLPAPYFIGRSWTSDALTVKTQDNVSGNVAEGNVISSVGDLANWIRKLMKGEAGINAPSTDPNDYEGTGDFRQYYRLGLTYTPGLGYGHDGIHAGYVTVVRHDPAHDLTTVLVSCTANASDTEGQLTWMYGIISKARIILGYPGLP